MARDFISDIIEQEFPLFYAFDFDKETSPKQGVFLAKDGLYERTHQAHFDMLYKTNSLTTRSGVGELKAYVDPVPEMPRVPIKIVATIFAFFREIYNKAKTEVQINVYWNRDHKEIPDVPGMMSWGNDLYTYVPKQRVSTARTTFEDDETYLWMIRNTVIVLDTHSHHDMSAFMSGTDKSSSNVPAVYFDMGRITSKNAQIFAWCAIDDQHIFENLPLSELYKFMEPLPEPVAEPVRTWDRVSRTWKSYAQPIAGTSAADSVVNSVKTPVSNLYGTPKKSSEHLFDSETLMSYAIEIPKEWGEQVILPKPTPRVSSMLPYSGVARYTNADLMTMNLNGFEDGFGVQGTLWDNFESGESMEFEEAQESLMIEVEFTSLVHAIIRYPDWAIDRGLVNRYYEIVTLSNNKDEILKQVGYDGQISLKDCHVEMVTSVLSDGYGLFTEELESGAIDTLADFTNAQLNLIQKINDYSLSDPEGIIGNQIWFDIIDVFGEENAFRLEMALVNNDLDIWFKRPNRNPQQGFRRINHDIFKALEIEVAMTKPLIDILGLESPKPVSK